MRSLSILVLIAAALASCQATGDALSTGSTAVTVSGQAASAIAGDMSSRFAEQVPPASTTLQLKADQSDFSVALTAALKGWGYTVIDAPSTSDGKAVKLDYALSGLDGQVLAQLTTPSIALSRAYSASPAGASATSPLSVMHRN